MQGDLNDMLKACSLRMRQARLGGSGMAVVGALFCLMADSANGALLSTVHVDALTQLERIVNSNHLPVRRLFA
jgi:hypothetical protein